jgi:hypothetical protein
MGCSPNPSENEETLVDSPFYDLKAFFNDEIERLTKEQPNVLKRVAIQEKKEENQFDQLNYKQELQVFVDADINKVAWFDRYEIDSTQENQSLKKLTYTAKSTKLKTRIIQITFDDQQTVQEVKMVVGTENQVAGSKKELTYITNQGYKIETVQRLIGSSDKTVSLEVRFLE